MKLDTGDVTALAKSVICGGESDGKVGNLVWVWVGDNGETGEIGGVTMVEGGSCDGSCG